MTNHRACRPQRAGLAEPLTPLAPSTARRALDILVAGTALVVLSPLLAGAAVLVKLSDDAPVLWPAAARRSRRTRPCAPLAILWVTAKSRRGNPEC